MTWLLVGKIALYILAAIIILVVLQILLLRLGRTWGYGQEQGKLMFRMRQKRRDKQ